jgi:hypothetical protein
MRYYYALNNQALGPVPLEQLHQLHRVGTIKADTLVAAEGASGWQPYSVLFPAGEGEAVPTPPAAATAAPLSSSTPPPLARTAASGPGATPPPQDYGKLVLISWILLGATALVSLIPVLGCVSWVLLVPVFIATVVLGVMILLRGGTNQGVMILVTAVVILPIFAIVAPVLTTALFGAVTGAGEKAKSEKVSPAPGTTSTPGAAAGGLTAAAGDLPDAAEAKMMVNDTMRHFKDAVNAGSFDAFYATQLSDRWKREMTAAKLKNTFNPFIDRKIDLSPIFTVEPVIETPHIDGDDFLVLKGHYPVPKDNVDVFFDLSYSQEGSWKLSGINVRVKPTDD